MNESRCKSCGAALVWRLTKNGKMAPFDAQPQACPMCGGAGCSGCDEGKLWRSHFATCPNAAQHRRRKR